MESSFELWILIAIVGVFVLMMMRYLLVELLGHFILKSLMGLEREPTSRMSRTVGWGVWTIVALIAHQFIG